MCQAPSPRRFFPCSFLPLVSSMARLALCNRPFSLCRTSPCCRRPCKVLFAPAVANHHSGASRSRYGPLVASPQDRVLPRRSCTRRVLFASLSLMRWWAGVAMRPPQTNPAYRGELSRHRGTGDVLAQPLAHSRVYVSQRGVFVAHLHRGPCQHPPQPASPAARIATR